MAGKAATQDTPAAVAEDQDNAARVYVFRGPMKTLYLTADDAENRTNGVMRGQEVTLPRDRLVSLVSNGAIFATKDGKQLRSRADVSAAEKEELRARQRADQAAQQAAAGGASVETPA